MKVWLLIIITFLSYYAYSQDSKISGVITYFFNDNFGNRPDVSSEVIVLDSVNEGSIDVKSYDSLARGISFNALSYSLIRLQNSYKEYFNLLKPRPRKNKTEMDLEQHKIDSLSPLIKSYQDSAVLYGISSGVPSSLDTRVTIMQASMSKNDNSIKRTVDGSGNYSFSLSHGTYIVFVKSKNRDGHTMSEVDGMVYFKKVVLPTNAVKDVSHNFGLND